MLTLLKITSGAFIVSAAVLAYYGARRPPPPPPTPAVTISPSAHDWGALTRDQVVTAKFVVKNTHPFAVTAGPSSHGCTCSEVTVTPETIPPGGEAELSFTWTLLGRRGASTESVLVPYAGAGGLSGSVLAVVKGTVTGVIDPDVEVLDLTTDRRIGKVTFTSMMARKFKITSCATSHPSLKASVCADERSVNVEFDPGVRGWGSGRLILAVRSDQPDEPEVKVWVRVTEIVPLK